MVGAPSFSQLYLSMQPPLQSPAEIRSCASVSLQLPILLLLV